MSTRRARRRPGHALALAIPRAGELARGDAGAPCGSAGRPAARSISARARWQMPTPGSRCLRGGSRARSDAEAAARRRHVTARGLRHRGEQHRAGSLHAQTQRPAAGRAIGRDERVGGAAEAQVDLGGVEVEQGAEILRPDPLERLLEGGQGEERLGVAMAEELHVGERVVAAGDIERHPLPANVARALASRRPAATACPRRTRQLARFASIRARERGFRPSTRRAAA